MKPLNIDECKPIVDKKLDVTEKIKTNGNVMPLKKESSKDTKTSKFQASDEDNSTSKTFENKTKSIETSTKENIDEKIPAFDRKNEKRKGGSDSKEKNESLPEKKVIDKTDSQVDSEETLKENGKDNEDTLEEDEEDVSGMRSMRKETNDAFANMEAEMEAGRSKLAALRARIRKAREMSKVVIDE